MSHFPAKPNFQGLFAPSRLEADSGDLEVEGTLPDDLDGVSAHTAIP